MIKRLLSVASLIVLSASVIVSDDSLPPIVVGKDAASTPHSFLSPTARL
jgi:hypothetical protein